jgi:hypothetical protein
MSCCQPAASCGQVCVRGRRPCRVALTRVMRDEPVRGVWAPDEAQPSGAQTPRTGSSLITRASSTLHGLRTPSPTRPQLAAGWQLGLPRQRHRHDASMYTERRRRISWDSAGAARAPAPSNARSGWRPPCPRPPGSARRPPRCQSAARVRRRRRRSPSQARSPLLIYTIRHGLLQTCSMVA